MHVVAYSAVWSATADHTEVLSSFQRRWPTGLPALSLDGLYCEAPSDSRAAIVLHRPEFQRLLQRADGPKGGNAMVVDDLHALGASARIVATTLEALDPRFGVLFLAALPGRARPVRLGRDVRHVLRECVRLEQDAASERTRRGQAKARRAGSAIGRPFRLDPAVWPTVEAHLESGASVRATARRFGVAEGTIRAIRDRRVHANA